MGGWLLRPGLRRLRPDIEQRQPVVFYQGTKISELETDLIPNQIGVLAEDTHLPKG